MVALLWLALAQAGDLRMITLDDALEATEASNPALRRAALAQEQSAADVRSALGGFDPQLTVSGGWDRASSLSFQLGFPEPFASTRTAWNLGTRVTGTAPTGTSMSFDGRLLAFRQQFDTAVGAATQDLFQPSFTFGLSQELLRGVRMAFNMQNVRRSREGESLAELQVAVARQDALAATATAFLAWEESALLADLANASVLVADEALRVGVARVGRGELAEIERTRLEAALVQAKSTAIEASFAVDAARDRLLLLMGETPGQEARPAAAVGDAPSYQLDPARAAEVALAQSPSLAAQRAAVEHARLAEADAKHATWPTLTANLEGGVNGGDTESWARAFQFLSGFPTVSVGGNFTMPLGGRAATGQLQRASTQIAIATAQLAETERQLLADVGAQVRALSNARQKVDLADTNAQLAEQTLRIEEALYQSGRAILKDVLESRDALSKARGEAIRARVDVRRAEVELMRLQGVDLSQ